MPHLFRRLAAFTTALLTATVARAVELRPGDIVAVDARDANERVLRIDPETGSRELIAAMGKLVGALGIAIDARDRLLIAVSIFGDGATSGVVELDPVTGIARVVSVGGLLAGPLAIAVERDGQIAVSDSQGAVRGSIVRIDPVTGAQALVSAGGELVFPSGLSLLPDGDFLVAGTGFGGTP